LPFRVIATKTVSDAVDPAQTLPRSSALATMGVVPSPSAMVLSAKLGAPPTSASAKAPMEARRIKRVLKVSPCTNGLESPTSGGARADNVKKWQSRPQLNAELAGQIAVQFPKRPASTAG
jgi:hypothetical protein